MSIYLILILFETCDLHPWPQISDIVPLYFILQIIPVFLIVSNLGFELLLYTPQKLPVSFAKRLFYVICQFF